MLYAGAEIRSRAAVLTFTETSFADAAEGVDLNGAADVKGVTVIVAGVEFEAPAISESVLPIR